MRRLCSTVIKVGGSLFDWQEFPQRMTDFLSARQAADRDERMVLIAGGGRAADLVRDLDRIHGFGEQTSHRLALHAMDLTAVILAELLPGTVAVQSLDALSTIWSAGAVPILAPRLVLAEMERAVETALPESWDVTSDTIAALLAVHLAAGRLVLLKSAPLPPGANRMEAARSGLVDALFPIVARPLHRVEYLNLRESGFEPRLLP